MDGPIVSAYGNRIHLQAGANSSSMLPGVVMNIKLRHYSVVYSSAMEPDLELNSFHEATAASRVLDFLQSISGMRLLGVAWHGDR